MPAGSRQLEIDWSRGRQLALLRDCVLPGPLFGADGRRVAQSTAKLILQQIDHFGRGRTCWVGEERLAQGANVTRRTVIRATQALATLGILIVERDGRRQSNRYTVVWSELALLCPSTSLRFSGSPVNRGDSPDSRSLRPQSAAGEDSRGPEFHRAPGCCENRAEQSDTWTEQSDTWTEQSDTCVTLSVLEGVQEPPPPTPSLTKSVAEAVHWGSAAAELRNFGVQRVTKTVQDAKARGLSPVDVLEAIRTAGANAGLFVRPAAALVGWIQTGEWPADGVQDWQTVESLRQRTAERRTSRSHQSVCMDCWRAIRDRTPRGEVVDDRAVVAEAIRRGVPRELALQFGGLEVSV